MSITSIQNLIEVCKEASRRHPNDREKRIAYAVEQRSLFLEGRTVVKPTECKKGYKNKKNLQTYSSQGSQPLREQFNE
jgi:hypothetical protein